MWDNMGWVVPVHRGKNTQVPTPRHTHTVSIVSGCLTAAFFLSFGQLPTQAKSRLYFKGMKSGLLRGLVVHQEVQEGISPNSSFFLPSMHGFLVIFKNKFAEKTCMQHPAKSLWD